MPSVRGRSRLLTIGALLASGIGSASLLGFGSGIALGWVPDPSHRVIIVGIAVALIADVVHQQSGRLTPLAIGTQVPREWSRFFAAPVAAILYGARLGIGPLTILSTWTWWAVIALAAMMGPGIAVLVGASFGAVRMASTVIASLIAERAGRHSSWFSQLRRRQPIGTMVLGSLALALVLAACSTATEIDAGPDDPPIIDAPDQQSEPTTDEDDAVTDPSTTIIEDSDNTVGDGTDDEIVVLGTTEVASEPDPAPDEQGVTQGDSGPDAAPAAEPVETGDAPTPEMLAASVLDEVPGFAPVPDTGANTFLSLEAAAARQPDPTEERPLLETRGYRGGWTRAFRNDTQDVVITSVYDFENATEAAFYLEDGLIIVGGYGGQLFDVEGEPAFHGFRQDSEDEIGPLVTHGITFTEDNRWYLVFVYGDPATATVDIVVDAARAQRALAQQSSSISEN